MALCRVGADLPEAATEKGEQRTLCLECGENILLTEAEIHSQRASRTIDVRLKISWIFGCGVQKTCEEGN